jgi:hypothetical protein
MKHAATAMKAQGSGCIINNSSIAAIRMNQGGYLYTAAKAAVTHITRLAGTQLGPSGIRVNSISPGAIATPIFWGGSQVSNTLSAEQNQRKMEKLKLSLAKATPLPRAGLDKDIAYAALFLASDEGSFVNCHDLVPRRCITTRCRERFDPACAGPKSRFLYQFNLLFYFKSKMKESNIAGNREPDLSAIRCRRPKQQFMQNSAPIFNNGHRNTRNSYHSVDK